MLHSPSVKYVLLFSSCSQPQNGITDAQKNEALALAKEKLGKGANVQISLTEEVSSHLLHPYRFRWMKKFLLDTPSFFQTNTLIEQHSATLKRN